MQESIRDSIIAHIHPAFETAFAGVPVAYPNAPFNWSTLPDRFVEVDVEFQDGDQVGMSANPARRVRGHVYVSSYTRLGTGLRTSLQIIDWFSDRLKFQSLGLAQLEAPVPDGNEKNVRGFHVERLKVCFYSRPG